MNFKEALKLSNVDNMSKYLYEKYDVENSDNLEYINIFDCFSTGKTNLLLHNNVNNDKNYYITLICNFVDPITDFKHYNTLIVDHLGNDIGSIDLFKWEELLSFNVSDDDINLFTLDIFVAEVLIELFEDGVLSEYHDKKVELINRYLNRTKEIVDSFFNMPFLDVSFDFLDIVRNEEVDDDE